MNDSARPWKEMDAAVEKPFSQLEKLRQYVELLHIECAASTKRRNELQNEMVTVWHARKADDADR